MSDRSPARGWPRASPADPVEDVLQHRTQISGQPAILAIRAPAVVFDFPPPGDLPAIAPSWN